jgi:hypothetical protein
MMGDWLQVVWKKRPRVLFRKYEMLVLHIFKGHLTLDVRPVIHEAKTGLMIITGGMTSQLHVLVHKPCNVYMKEHILNGSPPCSDTTGTNRSLVQN